MRLSHSEFSVIKNQQISPIKGTFSNVKYQKIINKIIARNIH